MKEEMIDLLLEESIGMVVAVNILASLSEGLLKRSILRDYLFNCIEAFKESKPKDTLELIRQFEDVARGERPLGGKKTVYLLACLRKTTIVRESSKYSTFTTLRVLKEHLISDDAVNSGHYSFFSYTDPTDYSVLKDAIEGLNGRTDFYKSDARLGRPDKPIFWITPTEIVAKERECCTLEESGDAIRDLLGLIDYKDNIPLIEICIPGKTLRRFKHTRPTFADAGSHSRFKTYSDGKNTRYKKGWGYTVNLKSFAEGRDNINGAPERVVEAFAFDHHLGVRIEFAGATKTIRGKFSDDDKAFANLLTEGISVSHLKSQLLGLML